MRAQGLPDSSDRVPNALGNLPARKVRPARADDVLPKRIAHALVQRAVAKYGKLPRLRRDEDQRRVGVFVPMQLQLVELSQGARERVDRTVQHDAHGDATARAILRFADGAGD